jgi:hypothetical protein
MAIGLKDVLNAGFTANDINYMTSQDFIQAAEQGDHQNKSLAKSLSHFVSSLDHNVTDAYLNEAHRGNDILSVRILRLIKLRRFVISSLLIMHNTFNISIPGRKLIFQIPDIVETGRDQYLLRSIDSNSIIH